MNPMPITKEDLIKLCKTEETVFVVVKNIKEREIIKKITNCGMSRYGHKWNGEDLDDMVCARIYKNGNKLNSATVGYYKENHNKYYDKKSNRRKFVYYTLKKKRKDPLGLLLMK